MIKSYLGSTSIGVGGASTLCELRFQSPLRPTTVRTRGGGVLEPGFEEMGASDSLPGEEVAVAVEGDGDAAVAHGRS